MQAETARKQGPKITSEILDRVPPHDLPTEKALLSALMVDLSRMEDIPFLAREDFHNDDHGKVFSHLQQFPGDGAVLDETLLIRWLKSAEDIERIGPLIGELFQQPGLAANVAYYGKIIKAAADKRRLIYRLCDGLKAAYNGHEDPAALACEITASIDSLDLHGQDARFKIVSCAELATSDYNVKYLVQDVLVEGVSCMVGGQLKTLKTLLAISLAISLATGRAFLNTFSVLESARVIYFIGEGGLSVAKDYARRIAASMGIELEDIDGLAFCDKVPRLADLEEVEYMASAIRDHGATVCCLDPLYLALEGKDSGNIMAQGPIFRNFARLCADTGTTPVIVHHLKKNRATANLCDPPELAELAWSGPAEYAGQWLLIGRHEPYNPDEPGRHSLWLSCGGRAGHSSLHVLSIDEGRLSDPGGRKWEVDVLSPHDARSETHQRREATKELERLEKLEDDKRKLCDALAKFPEGETERMLRPASGVYGVRFRAALAELVREGSVVPAEVHRQCRRTPYDGWRLGDTDAT